MRKLAPLAAVLFSQVCALSLVACGGGDGDDGPDGGNPAPPPPVAADTTAPTVPSNVTATAQTATQVLVTWSASTDAGTGVAGYRVYRNGSATALASVTALNYTDTSVVASTSYTYTVRAFDGAAPANESAVSTAVGATTPAPPLPGDVTPPTIPTNVTATAQSSSAILVSWTASTDANGVSGYRVYRNGGATPVVTVATTNYTDTGLTASTAYTYTVRAVDAAMPANQSADSTPASATTTGGTTPPPVSGLDARPANASCLAGARPIVSSAIGLERAFPNLTFSNPIAMLQPPNDSSRWFVVEQGGRVRVFANQANVGNADNFINISNLVGSGNGETGLLGMAFHPNFPTDPRVYLSYTHPMGGLDSRVSEFRSTDGGATLDENTEVQLLSVDQPEDNHNGGNIAFGPDGFLYIGFGDGGGGGDNHGLIGNGQRLNTLLGKMLRIDIAGSTGNVPYQIPADNPFAGNAMCNAGGQGSADCPEIYAFGFRNPWRWSFDRGSGELWLGDVGQSAYEEIDRVTRGGNFGWRCREGAHNYNLLCGLNGNSIDPVAEVGRTFAQAITGGYVYRGTAIPGLIGRYVFGDFATGQLWSIERSTTPTLTMGAGLTTGLSIASFGQGVDGELYVVHYGGTLHRVVPGAGAGGQIPTQLSATGCVNAANPTQPASGLIPYAPISPFFSDGATKNRWLALPDGQNINVTANNDFDFPNGSVLVKNFTIGSQLVETRLFMRHTDGEWAGYTYEWNAQGTDATRVIGGKTVTVAGQTWQFPSEAQCLQCHTEAAGRSLGLEIPQLNSNFGYPTGRTANQLTTLNAINTLTPALSQDPAQLPALRDPLGSAGTLTERARSYLHSNCSYCHQPNGGTPVGIDLRYNTTLLATNACDAPPNAGDLGIGNARIIAPGDAARSVLISRVNRTGTDAMPPLMRHTIDTAGVQVLTDWVNSLSGCN